MGRICAVGTFSHLDAILTAKLCELLLRQC